MGTILTLGETFLQGGVGGRWVGAGTVSAALRSSRQEQEMKGPEGTRRPTKSKHNEPTLPGGGGKSERELRALSPPNEEIKTP